ncbi:MAG: hypothetical protein KDC87_07615 [Planctomycetes bacterium]|nr:hypothetical protein [Planctomycetota bacterium]
MPSNKNSVFLTSTEPLSPGANYRIVVTCEHRGKPSRKEWTFRTATTRR